MTAGDRVRCTDDTFPAIGTVVYVSPVGYARVAWDDGLPRESFFSPRTAERALVVVTGDDAKPRHDWDTEQRTDPHCVVCGAVQTRKNYAAPCQGS